MESRAFVFKIGVFGCASSAVFLAIAAASALAGLVLASLIGGLTLELIGIAAFLMSFALKWDTIGKRSLIGLTLSLLVCAVEVFLLWGRAL